MKKIYSILLALTASFFITSTYASTRYAIIVDAGSTGSRAHLFKYQTGPSLPIIEDIFSANIKPGLSAFANNPDAAGPALSTILTAVNNKLHDAKIDPRTVTINVLATAGMRLLPLDSQQKIYANVKAYIQQHYVFSIQDIKTISGKEEAIFDWLDVNYLAGNFQKNTMPVGTIDMGGASTQIAFVAYIPIRSKDRAMIIFGHQAYPLFVKSFLGLGQDQARASIAADPLMNTCYPTGYQINATTQGSFQLPACGTAYLKLIQKNNVAQQLPPLANQSFVAFSGAYYDYQFFNVDKTPHQNNLEQSMQSICSQSWDQLKSQFPTIADSYLSTYCANGVFLDELFYATYRLNQNKLSVINSIGQTNIDWTLGAMLFKSTGQPAQGG